MSRCWSLHRAKLQSFTCCCMIALGAGLDSFSAASKQKNESVLQLEEMCAVVEWAFVPEVGTSQIPPPKIFRHSVHFKDWLWGFNLRALLRIQVAFTRLNSYLKQKSWETETRLESCAYKWFGFNCSFACSTLRYNMQCKCIFLIRGSF